MTITGAQEIKVSFRVISSIALNSTPLSVRDFVRLTAHNKATRVAVLTGATLMVPRPNMANLSTGIKLEAATHTMEIVLIRTRSPRVTPSILIDLDPPLLRMVKINHTELEVGHREVVDQVRTGISRPITRIRTQTVGMVAGEMPTEGPFELLIAVYKIFNFHRVAFDLPLTKSEVTNVKSTIYMLY